MKFKINRNIPKIRRFVVFSLIAWCLHGKSKFILIDLRAFSRSHGLAFEISSLDDINTIAATYKNVEITYIMRIEKNTIQELFNIFEEHKIMNN